MHNCYRPTLPSDVLVRLYGKIYQSDDVVSLGNWTRDTYGLAVYSWPSTINELNSCCNSWKSSKYNSRRTKATLLTWPSEKATRLLIWLQKYFRRRLLEVSNPNGKSLMTLSVSPPAETAAIASGERTSLTKRAIRCIKAVQQLSKSDGDRRARKKRYVAHHNLIHPRVETVQQQKQVDLIARVYHAR